jgi:hypothetical protein
MENTEHICTYTIDVSHEEDKAETGKHICHDFTKYGVLGKMDEAWAGQSFKYVIMDCFYTPSSWHDERWGETMYTII